MKPTTKQKLNQKQIDENREIWNSLDRLKRENAKLRTELDATEALLLKYMKLYLEVR